RRSRKCGKGTVMADEQDSKRVVSRRAMLAGAGAAAIGAASGVTLGLPELAGASTGGSQNGGSIDTSSASAPAELAPSAVVPRTLILNTLDFVPITSGNYAYVVPGGVKPVAAGFWNCPVTLPPGTTIQKIDLFINPGGTARPFSLTRYNGTVPNFNIVASATTTN